MKDRREIRLYQNRRLYDSSNHCYVKYEDLYGLVAAGQNLYIIDWHTGADVTRRVLLNIVCEVEGRCNGPAMFSVEFLHEILRMNAHGHVALAQCFLDHSITTAMSSAAGEISPGSS